MDDVFETWETGVLFFLFCFVLCLRWVSWSVFQPVNGFPDGIVTFVKIVDSWSLNVCVFIFKEFVVGNDFLCLLWQQNMVQIFFYIDIKKNQEVNSKSLFRNANCVCFVSNLVCVSPWWYCVHDWNIETRHQLWWSEWQVFFNKCCWHSTHRIIVFHAF